MDFPEHSDRIKRLDQSEDFVKLPKLDKELVREIKGNSIDLTDDPGIKEVAAKSPGGRYQFSEGTDGIGG